jgi:protein phosphatase
MSTTLVAAWFTDASRGMVGRGRQSGVPPPPRRPRQLTEDHSLLNDYIKARHPSAAEIEAFPHKNVIMRALGMRDQVEVDLVRLDLEDGDVILLCCDGLSGMVTDDRVAEVLRGCRELEQATQALVAAANEAGGIDNITVVLAQFHA